MSYPSTKSRSAFLLWRVRAAEVYFPVSVKTAISLHALPRRSVALCAACDCISLRTFTGQADALRVVKVRAAAMHKAVR